MIRFINRYDPLAFYRKNIERRIYRIKTLTMIVRYKSHYHTLELDSTASAKDIKSAYYKLSILYHPDKNKGSEESVAKFREISEAYEVLSNPEKKVKYDQEYRFEPHYSSNFREKQAGRYSPRSTAYGRPKDFNYEEHYRQHYENVKKQREIEFEYFKRRWEAEFYRKYPTVEHYYRNRHREQDETSEHIFKKIVQRRRVSYFVLGTWGLLFLIVTIIDYFNPEKRYYDNSRPIYYKTKHKNDSID